MNRNELMNIVDQLKELMGADKLLDELCQAMSSKELEENLEHIDRMNDTNLMNGENES